MLVETYEAHEVDSEGSPECDAEAIALIESLGLDGQQQLLTPRGERPPYRKATKEEMFVIRAVCPKETEIKKYSDGPIPLRVLQVAAHAQELYDTILVFSPENADEKDPYLIGRNGSSYSAREFFLLARWGEELIPWPAMIEKAVAIGREKLKATCESIARKATAMANGVSEMGLHTLVKQDEPVAYHLD